MNSVFQSTLHRKIKWMVITFQLGLFVPGVTAFFIPGGVEWTTLAAQYLDFPLHRWLTQVHIGVQAMDTAYPFIFYGTDWLAFAHILFTILFIGVFRDPVRNKWIVDFGLIACVLIFPTALLAGWVREIPLAWRWMDCAFGVIGIFVLLPIKSWIKQLETFETTYSTTVLTAHA
ncbi:MAG: hypothetical protein H6608_01645 [Flavobacteriales bacterium]|nr:hypothetical protein [Flavobacteriales bacterium]